MTMTEKEERQFEHEQREACRMRFDNIEKWQEERDKRIEESGKMLQTQEVAIGKLLTKMETLTESIQGLSKALWGAATFVGAMGIAFIIWYIQKG